MRASALTGMAAAITALAVVLSGCGSDTKTATSSSSSTASSSKSSSKSASPTTKPKVAQREEEAAGPNPTIATYIKDNGITEAPVKMGDPGAPTINLPVPEGWEPAGEDTPDWAFGAIVYTGPEGAEYSPSIVAIVSKLTGDVDPQKLIDVAGGELNNLPGYKPMNEGQTSVAQKTVIIPAADGYFVLQLNADGLEDQGEIVGAATDVIDSDTTITT